MWELPGELRIAWMVNTAKESKELVAYMTYYAMTPIMDAHGQKLDVNALPRPASDDEKDNPPPYKKPPPAATAPTKADEDDDADEKSSKKKGKK